MREIAAKHPEHLRTAPLYGTYFFRVNTRLKEAPSHKKTIFEYDPDSSGAKDYGVVADWIVRMAPVTGVAEAAVAPVLAAVPAAEFAVAVAK